MPRSRAADQQFDVICRASRYIPSDWRSYGEGHVSCARAEEEAYFRRIDAELIAKLRQNAQHSEIAHALAEKLHADEPALLEHIKKLGVTLDDGTQVAIPPGQDPREVLVDWLLDEENHLLAEAAANRIWSWLLGRGIVEPADDIRPNNPPSNPALLTYLGQELMDSGYDLKHLYRLILNSHIYQLSCIPESENSQAGANFAYYRVRRMEAEVLIDALCQVTGTFEPYSSIIPEPFTFLPDGHRAVCLPDG
jgi:hypothetical protein